MIKTTKRIGAGLAVAAMVAGWQGCNPTSAEGEKTPEQPPVVSAFLLTEGTLPDTLSIPGELVAFQYVDLYAKVSSFVKRLYADVGSEVRTGQLLAVMEAPELNAQSEGAQSRVQSQEAVYLASKATYDRLLETSKTPGTISQNDLDVARARQQSDYAQYQAAKAALKEVHDNRSYLEIRAPFPGVITARNVSAGAYVGPGAGAVPMFTLQEQKKLRLVVKLPESNAGVLDQNGMVRFTVKSLPGQQFTAKTSRVSGALDNRLRAQHVEMDVLNADKQLLPGMIPEVQIPLQAGKEASFVIPGSALLNSSQGIYVIKLVNGKTVWVPVQTGVQTAGKVAVYGDLKAGDTLITTVTEEVRNGAPAGGKINLQ
ncbi:efflux RND transporter periplasmic adaptor subunit [Niabella drilacis]|uniref:RND family efflux transporter, MFP subunit n=1 Tax=Niabella drilacis (strain DSM 25811 / CCM 8410 / CCUG 62505 / LMG 26954 / E90) TaxID=1285928 RepID=A0A1G6VRZ8_NIADE|nr:efflux RND transporter periplasmic adaptor subunit [Niabella drilacis]SDD56460.1 RND family efflux transporter, MFP subunit [Niabella drilacis]